jgi:hypothetical protein
LREAHPYPLISRWLIFMCFKRPNIEVISFY